MDKCQEKFKQIEELQNKYSKQLSEYDSNSLKLFNNTNTQIQGHISNQSSYHKELLKNEHTFKMLKDMDNITKNINDKAISDNYVNFCSFLLMGPPAPSVKTQIQKEKIIKKTQKIQSKPVNNEKLQENTINRANSGLIKPKIVISVNQDLTSSIDWKEDQKAKDIIIKKQNIFLSNELVNLKVKIGKLNNKNIMLSNMIKSQEQVKNFKVLDKFIESFIEKLAINWNEIVKIILSELLEEEVIELNALELQKIDYERLRLTTFEDVMKNCSSNRQMYLTKFNIMFESMDEVNAMISKAKETENSLSKKYNIKHN